ncbi:hypothetical protein ACP70R_002663 [Stipagrostis hirtigluma subsp. patula]
MEAMRSCPRLGSPLPEGGESRGSPRRRRSDHGGGGGGEDRISALPDALLIKVVHRLRSTAEAGRTSALSSRWCNSWPQLHELSFCGVGPDTLAGLLARVLPEIDHLEICVPGHLLGGGDAKLAATQISSLASLLASAERLNQAELNFDVGGGDGELPPFELPCFARATSMKLQVRKRPFTLPPAGEFAKLNSLTLSLCSVAPAYFLPRCPRLCVLNLRCYWVDKMVTISSESLEVLVLIDAPRPVDDGTSQRVDIVAPKLRKFRLQSSGNRELIASYPAQVEELFLRYCTYPSNSFCWHWHALAPSKLGHGNGVEHHTWTAQFFSCPISADTHRPNTHPPKRSFEQEIARLPVTKFPVLKLGLRTEGRGYGSILLHVLKDLKDIKKAPCGHTAKYSVYPIAYENDEPHNQGISLTALEEIELEGFDIANDDELELLNRLLTSAPMLKIARIQSSTRISRSDNTYRRLCSILLSNASVECFVNGALVRRSAT